MPMTTQESETRTADKSDLFVAADLAMTSGTLMPPAIRMVFNPYSLLSLLILFNDGQSFIPYLRQRLSAGMLTSSFARKPLFLLLLILCATYALGRIHISH